MSYTGKDRLNFSTPGAYQEGLGTKLDEILTAVREMHDDHATFKTAADNVETLIEEMHDDHATLKTAIDAIKAFLQNQITTGNPGLAGGTTASKVKTANTVEYTINGIGYSKAAADDFWTLSGAAVPDGQFNKYILYIDNAGAASIGEGTAAATAAGVTLPAIAANKCILGLLQVQNASGADFTPGTTALNASGITATYANGLSHAALLSKVLPDPPATLSTAKPASAPAALAATKPTALST